MNMTCMLWCIENKPLADRQTVWSGEIGWTEDNVHKLWQPEFECDITWEQDGMMVMQNG